MTRNLTPRATEKGKIYNGMQANAAAEVAAKSATGPAKAKKAPETDADGYIIRQKAIQATIRQGAVINGVTISKSDVLVFVSREKGSNVKGHIFDTRFDGIQIIARADVLGMPNKVARVSTRVLSPMEQIANNAIALCDASKNPDELAYVAACEAIMAMATDHLTTYKTSGNPEDLFEATRSLWKWYTLQRTIKLAGVTVAKPKADKVEDLEDDSDFEVEDEESSDDTGE